MRNRAHKVFAKAMVIVFALLHLVSMPVSASERFDQQELLAVRYDRINQLLRGGRLEQALKQALKALEMAENIYGKYSAGTAPAVDRVAAVYRAMGLLDDAEKQLRLALDLVRKELGDNHRHTVSALNNLAGLYKEMGRYGESEKHYLQAIDNQRRLAEQKPDDEIGLLSNLAVLYMINTRYAEAEPLLKRALTLAEKDAERDWLAEKMKLSNDSQQAEVGRRMLNLANLYFKMKRYDDSGALANRALDIFRRVYGEVHPEVARARNDLGMLNIATGDFAAAESHLTGALDIALGIYGDKPQPLVAEYYSGLAYLYERTGKHNQALTFSRHSLDILEKTVGKNNPRTLRCLNSIAVIQANLGNFKQAEQILRDVLESTRILMGEKHESLASGMSNLASVLAVQGKHGEANRFFVKAIEIAEQKRENAFLILSEQQKLKYIDGLLLQVQHYLSHLSQHGPFSDGAVETAMNTWLRWKGAVLEAQGRYLDALYSSDSPLLQQRFDELAQVKRELAAIQMFAKKESGTGIQGNTADRLEKRKQSLEAELSGLSSRYARDKLSGTIDIRKLERLLPQDAVYIDFAEIEMADFSRHLSEKPRYVAFVLVPGAGLQPRLIDISDRDMLDTIVSGYLQEMKRKAESDPGHDPRRLDAYAQKIFDTVMKPLLPLFNGRKNLFVSPDGALNLIPLEVLLNSKGRYLVEEYQINYVASGRDIIRNTMPAEAVSGPSVVISDPDFDMQVAIPPGRTITAGGFRSVSFERLPDTKQEADAIVQLLRAADLPVNSYQGVKADEKVLLAVRNPHILHLATHGYFFKGKASGRGGTRGLKISLKGDESLEADTWIENPMLSSGIVLAGANSSLKQGSDYGMVSAEKILGVRLRGTDLVTLSACETGSGDVLSGEGVFGLKRAFLLSGAKTLVMSLWSVPSAETTELMTGFYTLMHKGAAKSQALRQAKLDMMKKNRHPFYWGAFIMIGKPD
jgi:CHAT domain-containing protein/tetratricopeptide (TPR) repeat protein